jgi:hypothetical protein
MNVGRIFTTAICVVLLGATSSARVLGQTDPLPKQLPTDSSGESPLPLSVTTAEQSRDAGGWDVGFGQPCRSRWTASAEFITLERTGTANQTLVSTYPGYPSPKTQYIVGQGTDQLYSSDLTQGFAGGPKISVVCHGESGCDLEVSYFQIDGWSNSASVASGTDTTPIFLAPGGFVQTTDSPSQFMKWEYSTRLYNEEVNVRWDLCSRVRMLAGFRWVNLSEYLEGTLPPERKVPFWDNTTKNNLYGLQIGADVRLFERPRFSLDGMVKAGLFDDKVDETTMVSIARIPVWESASTNHIAFVGEIGLKCKYQVTRRISLLASYEAIWLQSVALAPGQIPETYCHDHPISVEALGVNCGSGVFYHGATAGLEYAF